MKLCKCEHHSECPAAIVKSAETMHLCQTNPKLREAFMQNRNSTRPSQPAHNEQPGTVLARKIAWITGLKGTGSCGCKNLKAQMDREGCDWCEASRELIVSKMMKNAAQLVTFANIGEAVVNSAVGRAACKMAANALLTSAIETARAEANQKRKARPPRELTQRARRYPPLSHSPTIPKEPLPFTGEPELTLMFHVYPRGEGWRSHLAKMEPQLHRFKRKILGVAYDRDTYSVDDTVAAFGDGWEVFTAENGAKGKHQKGLREVATYQQMLPTLDTGPNDVTFCLHGKGSQTGYDKSDPIQWWIDAMYSTVYHNIDGVIDEMRNGAAIVGSFRKHSKDLGTRHRWHYSGTYYAFRNAITCSNGWPNFRQKWWGTESWPGDHFPLSASACIFGDRCGNLYHVNEQPRQQLEEWKKRT
jgi:hypothetical protein